MNKTASRVVLAALLIVGSGSVPLAATNNVYRSNYELTSEALIIQPADNQASVDAATELYLNPLGFDGTAETVNVPESIPGTTLEKTVQIDVQDLVTAIEQKFDAGDFDVSDPLYVFGYSQGAVAASLAEQQLADAGIPSGALHFVMVGDSASAQGGWLNTFVVSLPEWLRQFATYILDQVGVGGLMGSTTPDDLYPTDVYSLSGDGWANWDNGANFLGMFVDHLEYLGLTPNEIASATSITDGLTDYHIIDSADVGDLSALWNALMVAIS